MEAQPAAKVLSIESTCTLHADLKGLLTREALARVRRAGKGERETCEILLPINVMHPPLTPFHCPPSIRVQVEEEKISPGCAASFSILTTLSYCTFFTQRDLRATTTHSLQTLVFKVKNKDTNLVTRKKVRPIIREEKLTSIRDNLMVAIRPGSQIV